LLKLDGAYLKRYSATSFNKNVGELNRKKTTRISYIYIRCNATGICFTICQTSILWRFGLV